MYRSFQIHSIGSVGAAVYTQTFSQPAYLLTPQEGICGQTPKMLCRRRAFGCAAVGAAGRTLKAVLLETAAGQGRRRAAGLSRCTTRRAHAAIFCTSVDFLRFFFEDAFLASKWFLYRQNHIKIELLLKRSVAKSVEIHCGTSPRPATHR